MPQCQHGQSLVIAGLLSEDVREQVSQYPVLGQIPLLGGLFRSSRFQKNETELVIIVTPELVKPLGNDFELPTDYFIEPSALEFFLYGWLEGKGVDEAAEAGGIIGGAGYRVSTTTKEAE